MTPYANDSTLGLTSGNEKLNMPPFAVDIVNGQGNGDVTDAVIAMRGKILNDTSAQPEATVYFVACDYEEAETVAVALEQWFEALREGDVAPDVVDEVRHLAERYRMVPNPRRKPTLPPVGAHVQITESVERFPHFICPKGWTGEVVDVTDSVVSVRMYRYLGPGAEEWNNEVVFDENTEPGGFAAHCSIIE